MRKENYFQEVNSKIFVFWFLGKNINKQLLTHSGKINLLLLKILLKLWREKKYTEVYKLTSSGNLKTSLLEPPNFYKFSEL